MLEHATYKNHKGETIVFGENGIFLNESELHDFEWEPIFDGTTISHFERNAKQFPLPVRLSVESGGLKLREKLFSVFEKDILAGIPGTLIYNNYYLKCYIHGSKKEKYLIRDGYLRLELQVISDKPYWTKETLYQFPVESLVITSDFLDFPYGFPYDFAPSNPVRSFENNAFVASRFLIRVFGPVESPYLYIGGHLYRVTVSLSSGEHLEIDSREQTIVKRSRYGVQTNHFNDRDKENDVFKAIPAGYVSVSTDGTFAFDIILYDERSQAPWQTMLL